MRDPWVWALSAALLGATAALELVVPLGYAVWLAYFLAIGVTVFQRHAGLPLVVAVAACVFLAVGYNIAPASTNSAFSFVNRTIGGFAFLMIALIVNRAIQARREASEALWLQESENVVAMSLRGDLGPEKIAEAAMTTLAEQLKAQTAVMYRIENHQLLLTGGVALPASIPQSLGLEEGQLGQVIREGKVRHLQEGEGSVLQISTSLGSTQLRERVLAPIFSDEQIVGVVELGRIRPGRAPQLDRELLQRCADTIGIALRAAVLRARLAELLEESQRQGEELQAQQEELRVANEELEDQSRSLLHSQTNLEQQQAEMEQTNVQLEERTHELESRQQALLIAQGQLVQNSRELEASSRYKSEFLANMSHELRTPLNSALILSKLLGDNRDGNLSAEQVKFARTIHSSGTDLLNLINEILDLSKIEAGHIEVHAERFGVEKLLSGIAALLGPVASERGLSLDVLMMADCPPVIESDRQRIEQILKNLLSNALKFTEQGGVTVSASAGGEGEVVFTVTDTGIGIAPEQQVRIFEAFQQADGSTARKYGGTGLGLSMTYGFARQSGGSARIASEQGEGAEIELLLPEGQQQVEMASASTAQVQVQRGHAERILLVDDTDSVRMMVREMLLEVGYQVVEATNAQQALLELHSARAVDLLLSDVGLPGMNGRDLADAARALRPSLPVLFITGYTESAAVRNEFLGEGMSLLPKPFSVHELLHSVGAMFGPRQ